MKELAPAQVLEQVAAALPEDCKKHIVVIGSLAAGYCYFAGDSTKAVRTKDVDCILEPFESAVSTGAEIARSLIDAGWQRRLTGDHATPGTAETPVDKLPAVRLYPPTSDGTPDAWFIELLTVPTSERQTARQWTRIHLREGDFALPSFRYLSIVAYKSTREGALGIRCARPEMMALANLLEHPTIKPDTISGTESALGSIKRSNKDLGRVLAIATLSKLTDFAPWIELWQPALRHCFPTQWREIGSKLGDGLRELLISDSDFEQAYDTCINGLLSSLSTTSDQLRTSADRLLADAIEPLEQIARAGDDDN